ncbi:MAG: hypothetical protein IJR53_05755 [Bacteroidales bacterium]|nr:hypothetical protein [Bacteroidales bacterium]
MPYARTIRTFKEGLTRKGVFDQLFACFYQFLKNNNPLKDVDVNDAKAFLIFSSEDWDERLKVMPVQRVLICKDTEVLRQLKDISCTSFVITVSSRGIKTFNLTKPTTIHYTILHLLHQIHNLSTSTPPKFPDGSGGEEYTLFQLCSMAILYSIVLYIW